MSKIEWSPCYSSRMAQTTDGAAKVAAQKAGLTVAEYLRRKAAGLKKCTKCQEWTPLSDFTKDRTRYDGLNARCRHCHNSIKPPRVPRQKGRSFVPARDGDRKQARRRINYFVEAGLMPHPRTLPCVDCGHEWAAGERRHEYDHHMGYAAEHHETVEAVCTNCHAARTWAIRHQNAK